MPQAISQVSSYMSFRLQEAYELTAEPLVTQVLDGYTSALIAYGQSGGGKTHSMIGQYAEPTGPGRGVIPRACEHFFEQVPAARDTCMYAMCNVCVYVYV